MIYPHMAQKAKPLFSISTLVIQRLDAQTKLATFETTWVV